MRSKRTSAHPVVALATALASVALVTPVAAGDVYGALGVDAAQVMSGTVVRSVVAPGDERYVVCVVTYLTGKRDPARAANVKLGVLIDRGDRFAEVYVRDLGAESGGFVGNGDLQVVDLDRDGANELVLSWDDFSDPLIEVRRGEVIMHDGEGLTTVWRGELEYDATRAARSVPTERRDRFTRELDLAATMRSNGRTLWFEKTVVAVAGERLPTPSRLQESFPFRVAEP